MIDFKKYTLSNGLTLIVHSDPTSELATVSILYDVGSRDEDEKQTGFAHLFEHLMFGGSVNIPSYDEPLQLVGGENNAFTSSDVTNYYCSLPAVNLETALWLESDRMLSLSFDQKSLEVQRNVVIEEFKQRYLNQPYGDLWLKLRPLAYKVHPYRWSTIGKEISHIEEATMDDVRKFFKTHYIPNNAIIAICGNVEPENVYQLCVKWFGDIPAGIKKKRNLPVEPKQDAPRFLEITNDVPLDLIIKAYPSPGRMEPSFYAVDIISDILGRGHSSRLYQNLVSDKKIFNSLSCYTTGSMDPGLLVIEGKLNPGITAEMGDKELIKLISTLAEDLNEYELQKVKNKTEAGVVFGEISVMNKALNLCMAELMGDANLVNKEIEKIQSVTLEEVKTKVKELLHENNCSTFYYKSSKQLSSFIQTT